MAHRVGARFVLILVTCPDEVRKARMMAREANQDRVSDATWETVERLRERFIEPTEFGPGEVLIDPTGGAGANAMIESLLQFSGRS
ncbi:MAG: hypothetical protein EXR58_06165 [Chloroflexi bacterium]|nr:hypothetical protein [Chloroflexota bacterium]